MICPKCGSTLDRKYEGYYCPYCYSNFSDEEIENEQFGDYNESYSTNRLIMKHYPEMIRLRGSEVGMSLATALSVNALGEIDKVEALAMFRFKYVKGEHKLYIYIYFPARIE